MTQLSPRELEEVTAPLLAPRPFADFSVAEFRQYVVSLYAKRIRKAAKTKKPPKEYSVTKTKKGNLSIRVKREPKWLSRSELEAEALRLDFPLNLLWLAVKERKILVCEASEAATMKENLESFPW